MSTYWIKVALIAWFVFGALATVAGIGRPRKPLTPGVVIAALVVQAIVTFGVVLL